MKIGTIILSLVISAACAVAGAPISTVQSQLKIDAEKVIRVFRSIDVDSMNYERTRALFDHTLPGWAPNHGSCSAQHCGFEFVIKRASRKTVTSFVSLSLTVSLENDKIQYATLGYALSKELPRDSVAVDIQKLPISGSTPAFEVIKARGEGLGPPSAWIRMTIRASQSEVMSATTLNLDCLEEVDKCSSVADLSATIWTMIQENNSH